MITTTFRLAKGAGACSESYRLFAQYVGGIANYGKDTPIPLAEVATVLSLDDALWCLHCAENQPEANKLTQLLAADFAERVLPIFEKAYPDDQRPRKAIEASRLFAEGKIGAAARAAAGAAARAAEREWQLKRFKEVMS